MMLINNIKNNAGNQFSLKNADNNSHLDSASTLSVSMNTSQNTYEKLPELVKHKKQGFDYSLIEREGRIAWYEARYLNGSELVGYVVVKIRVRKGTMLPSGLLTSCREVFPAPSEFGKFGWFYMPKSRSASKSHYKELVEAEKEEMREAA
jgi:hypothetical protein